MKIVKILIPFLSLSLFLTSSKLYTCEVVQEKPPPPIQKELTIWEVAHNIEDIYNIPSDLLASLIWYESRGKMTAFHRNSNGTVDEGPCQYNSYWRKKVFSRYNNGEDFDPYSIISIKVAGAALAERYAENGSWYDTIASWNPGQKTYAQGVLNAYLERKVIDKSAEKWYYICRTRKGSRP